MYIDQELVNKDSDLLKLKLMMEIFNMAAIPIRTADVYYVITNWDNDKKKNEYTAYCGIFMNWIYEAFK